MKKICNLIIILSFSLSLLCGCGGTESRAEEAENIKVPDRADDSAAESSPGKFPWELELELKEENAADDSYSYTSPANVWPADYFRQTVLPEYLDRWVEDAEIREIYLAGELTSYYCLNGWVLFSGRAKPESGWRWNEIDGKPMYCRSFFAIGNDRGEWTVKKSSPLIPAPYINEEDIGERMLAAQGLTIEETHYMDLPDRRIEGLIGAQLYVAELDKCYTISDEESLEKLSYALSDAPYWEGPREPAPENTRLADAEELSPLYLHFENGETRLVLTIADGECGTNAWNTGKGTAFRGPESIFEIFSVPLSAEGYIRQKDGSTLIKTHWTQPFPDDKTPALGEALYDAEGRLVRRSRRLSSDGEELFIEEEYIYDERGLLTAVQKSHNGETGLKYSYEYNDLGNVIKSEEYYSDEQKQTVLFEYDEEDRLIAVIHLNGDGQPALLSANTYYWYDDSGECRKYGFTPSGEYSGDPPEGPVRRKK